MTVLHQPSMFDTAEEPALTPLGERVRRTELVDGAWVDHLPGWLDGSDHLLDRLLQDVPWRAERRQMYDREVDVPRLLCWYSGDAPLPHPMLHSSPRTRSTPITARNSANRSSRRVCACTATARTAWPGTATRSAVARTPTPWSRSCRSGRPGCCILRPRSGGASLKYPVGHGDLVVMGGSCQRTWEHAIPKTARPVGPRISIQFRPVGVA